MLKFKEKRLTSNQFNKKLTAEAVIHGMFPPAQSVGDNREIVRASSPMVAIDADFRIVAAIRTSSVDVPKGITDGVRHGAMVITAESQLPSVGVAAAHNGTQGLVGEDGERLINLIIRHGKQTPFKVGGGRAAHPRACPSSTVYSIPHASLFVNRFLCKDSINMD